MEDKWKELLKYIAQNNETESRFLSPNPQSNVEIIGLLDEIARLRGITKEENGIEFRRGLSGGGNQLLQPYIRKNFKIKHEDFPNIEHIHHFSWYIGNYPNIDSGIYTELKDLVDTIS